MINKAVIIGRLTKDIELKRTTNDIQTCSFTIAVNRIPSKNTQEKQADFINCVAWRNTAEYLYKHSGKGDLIGIDGRIQTRKYTKENQTIYITEVLVENANILSSKKSSQETNIHESEFSDDVPF